MCFIHKEGKIRRQRNRGRRCLADRGMTQSGFWLKDFLFTFENMLIYLLSTTTTRSIIHKTFGKFLFFGLVSTPQMQKRKNISTSPVYLKTIEIKYSSRILNGYVFNNKINFETLPVVLLLCSLSVFFCYCSSAVNTACYCFVAFYCCIILK